MLERSYEILRAARDEPGRRCRILRMPSAETVYEFIDPDVGVYPWPSGVTLDDGTLFPEPRPVPVIVATSDMSLISVVASSSSPATGGRECRGS